jgi:K+-sensing histidine kinase KdpD
MEPGRLHVYLGAVPAAGKTHAMLAEGRRLSGLGADVVVALVETHGRDGLDQLADGLEVVPRRRVAYRDASLEELDTDAVLARRPDVALIDELAHSNVPGSTRDKRWQDVEELLRAGIDVVTTLNVQHLAGLRDDVERITGVRPRELVPDEVVLAADRVDFVDADPRVVVQRVYGEQPGRGTARAPVDGFFQLGRLEALRQLARAWLASHDLVPAGPRSAAVSGVVPGPVVVALAPGAPAGPAVRRAAELAALRRAPLVGVAVRDASGIGAAVARESADLERMLAEFGGRYAEVGGGDIALELARFAEREKAGVLVIGDTSHSAGRRLVHGSVARRTLALAHGIEIYVVPPGARRRGAAAGPRPRGRLWGRAAVAGAGVRGLAGRGSQSARSQAQAGRLARLAASVLADPAEPASDLVAELREAFDLDAVGILARDEEGWRLVAGAGGPLPEHPDAAQFAAEIGPGRVLVMSGAALGASDAHPLQAFTGELLLARRRAQLEALEATASARQVHGHDAPAPAPARPDAGNAPEQPLV